MVNSILRVDDPYSGEIVHEAPCLEPGDLDALFDRARKAQWQWQSTDLATRKKAAEAFAKYFETNADAWAAEITRSMGKPLAEAKGEVRAMVDRARQVTSIAEHALSPIRLPDKQGFDRWIEREPVGVVVVLAAWNYPLLTAVGPVLTSVLAGNAVILKHSARTPRAADMFAEAMAAAGVPEHLVQAVAMDHDVAGRLVQHPSVGFVSFTGSVAGGRAVYQKVAEKRFAPVAMELGGKDAAYVKTDCDFDFTVGNVVEGALYNAGQSCCGIERVYVQRPLYDRFLDAAVAAAEALVIGDPGTEGTTLGPMAQASAPPFLAEQIDEARSLGARVLTGGQATQHQGKGRFFAPTVVADADLRMSVVREESFGPVMAVLPVDSDDDAALAINQSRYGLTASVWSQDVEAAKNVMQKLDVGTVFLNRADFLDPLLAWSGRKDSGFGVSLSELGFAAVTRSKSYHLRLPV